MLASILGAAIEGAILLKILLGRVALPCFAAFLLADSLFAIGMALVSIEGGGSMTIRYASAYYVAEPFVLALLVLAAVEAIGAVPVAAAASLAGVVIATMLATPAAMETRLAIVGGIGAALTVSLTYRRDLHVGLLLAFVLADVVAVLSIALGEAGLRPALFQMAAQLVPLMGWLVWVERIATRNVAMLREM